MTLLHDVGSWLLISCAFMAIAFCVGYHYTTDWRSSEIGRHLMAFTASEAAILSMYTIRITVGHDTWWFELIRLVVFLSFPTVLIWRLRILWKFQMRPRIDERRTRRERRVDDRAGPGGLPPEEQR